MKVTREYLKQLIKEEIENVTEAISPPPPPRQSAQPRKQDLLNLANQIKLIWDRNYRMAKNQPLKDIDSDRYLSNEIGPRIVNLPEVINSTTNENSTTLKAYLKKIKEALLFGGPRNGALDNQAILNHPSIKALRDQKFIMDNLKKWDEIISIGGLPPETAKPQAPIKKASMPPPPPRR